MHNKKVLIFGLGRLGGGVASAKWWAKMKAKLRITDLLPKKELAQSLKQLANIKANYVLGQNRKEDIDWADIVVVNPGVSYKNPLVKYAQAKGKQIENDCSLFFKLAQGDILAITGTRGKTTTSIWTWHFLTTFALRRFARPSPARHRYAQALAGGEAGELNLRLAPPPLAETMPARPPECVSQKLLANAILGGNQPDRALLKIISKTKKDSCIVLELSSFQLEFMPTEVKAPKIALITNLYVDHLNRYENLNEYASAKAKIFQNQTQSDYLILNYTDKFTPFFLEQKPKSNVYFFDLTSLPPNKNGIFIKNDIVYFQENSANTKWFLITQFKQEWAEHNVLNLLASLLASYLFIREKKLLSHSEIIENFKTAINSLPQVPLRQEVVFKNKTLKIINDSASTSPDATIQALRRFAPQAKLILITGGTDKNLDFKDLAKEIKARLKSEQVIFLNGSATQKLLLELKKIHFNYLEENAENLVFGAKNDTSSLAIFENLEDCIDKAFKNWELKIGNYREAIMLFSPGAASFEKFKNEFDRGQQFNLVVKKLL